MEYAEVFSLQTEILAPFLHAPLPSNTDLFLASSTAFSLHPPSLGLGGVNCKLSLFSVVGMTTVVGDLCGGGFLVPGTYSTWTLFKVLCCAYTITFSNSCIFFWIMKSKKPKQPMARLYYVEQSLPNRTCTL